MINWDDREWGVFVLGAIVGAAPIVIGILIAWVSI